MFSLSDLPSGFCVFESSSTPISNENRNSPDRLSRAFTTRSTTDMVRPANRHRRSSSITFASALVRRSSRRRSSQPGLSLLPINTLPIIQPETYRNPYKRDSRCFQINLNNARQQVTSLLALSTVPRPTTPLFDDFDSSSAIRTATQAAMEDEATETAIAASLVTHAAEEARWIPRPVDPIPLPQIVSSPEATPELDTNLRGWGDGRLGAIDSSSMRDGPSRLELFCC